MFSLWGSLLTLVASQSCLDPSEHSASWVRLKPLGQCKDGESTCPYRITLPPLTVQLPKPFRELEKMARELQRLIQMVNQLKEDCRVCKEKQGMDWNIRTDDEGKDRAKIQASRGTLNTKGRQQDIAKRESTDQVTTLRSAVEDIVDISNDEKEVNPTVLGKQRNTNQERNVNPVTTKPKAETSGGAKGSDSSQKNLISRKTFGEVPSVTTTKKKILQSPLDTLSESSFLGSLDNEQPTQHEKASTIKIGHERNPSGSLTAKGKVKSIPEYHVDSVVTVDDDDDDNEDGDVETKQMQTPKGDKVMGERQHVTGTDAQNNRELEPNVKHPTRKQQEKGDKKEVADPGIKESRSYIFEGTNNGNVAKEGHVSVTQQPSLKNKEQNENNNHTASSTKLKPLKPGTYSERADTIRGQKKLSSPIPGKASASVNVSQINSQTLEIKSKHGFKPDKNTGVESDGGMHSNPIYNVDTASGVKNSRSPTSGRTNTTAHVELIKPKIQKSNSQTPFKPRTNTESKTGVTLRNSRLPISGITDDIADVSPTNPQILDNNNQFKVGTDSESDAGIDSNTVNITKTVTGQKNSRLSILDRANTTADVDLQVPKRQSSNSQTSLKPNKNAEYNPEMDSNPVNKIKTVSGKEMLRSPISGTDEGTVNVSPTNPQILDSEKQLRTHTDSESDAVMDLNPVNNNDTVNGLKNSRSPISGRINATADLNLLNPRKPTSNSQTSLKSSKDKEHHIGMNLNPDNELKNLRSPISGITDGTVDVSPTNPQIVRSKNQVKVGRDSESDARVDSNLVNNTEAASGQEISRSDGIGDVGPTNQQILNSKNRFKTGTESENDAVNDLVHNVATLSASNNSGSSISDITDASEVNQTYPRTLDSTFKKQLQPGTGKERKTKTDSNPIIGRADARVRANQINTQKVYSNSKNTTVASIPVNKTVSLLETPRSPISGRFHPTTNPINPRAMDHISENPLKPGTVSERKVYPYRNHTTDTVNQRETSESRISDSRLDVNHTNPHLNSNNNLPKRQLLPKSKLNMTQPRNGRIKSVHPMSIDNERQQTLRNNKTTFLKKDGITSGRPLPTGLLPRTLEKQKDIINQPERTNHTGISLSKDPRGKKPYILQRRPVNEGKSFGSREPKNSSGVYNYTMNNGTTQVYSKTVSVMPTLATHGTVDQAHIKRVKNVKVLDTVNRHIESTSQTAVTKLKKPGGHSQQDLVLHTVNNIGRASQQPVVEEPKGIGRRTEQTPFKTSRVDSNQEKHKKPLRVGGTQIPVGKMPLAVASSERNELNYPTTTAPSYNIKTEFKNKQTKVSQFTPPITTPPHFMDQDHAEQAKTTSTVKVSNKHVHHRHENPSQEMESKKSHSDTGNKELQSGSNGQGSSEVTDLQPNFSDSIQSRAIGSTDIIMDLVKVSAGSKVSTTSTESTNENRGRDSDSVVGNNGGHSVDTNNGNSYPFTVNRMMGGTLHKILDGHTNNGHNKKPLSNMNERQGLEKQLLSNCHGGCDPSPTPWSEGNSHKSSNNDRGKECLALSWTCIMGIMYQSHQNSLKHGIYLFTWNIYCFRLA